MVLALLKSPDMHVLDVIIKCGGDYFFWRRYNYSVFDMKELINKSGELLKLSMRERVIH